MSLNTRSGKREPVKAAVEFSLNGTCEQTIKLADGGAVKSTLLDISITGCGIEAPYVVPSGSMLCITVDSQPFAAELGKERKEPFKFAGKVKSCVMKSAGSYRLGIQFTKIEKEDVEFISSFIVHKEQRKNPRWDMTK